MNNTGSVLTASVSSLSSSVKLIRALWIYSLWILAVQIWVNSVCPALGKGLSSSFMPEPISTMTGDQFLPL